MIPGEIIAAAGEIELNTGQDTVSIDVSNTGDRPVQVGSHYHFAETNAGLTFDRKVAYGRRLDIPAGTAVRFEPCSKTAFSLSSGGSKTLPAASKGTSFAVARSTRQRSLARLPEDGGTFWSLPKRCSHSKGV